jgi:hypothetical protein
MDSLVSIFYNFHPLVLSRSDLIEHLGSALLEYFVRLIVARARHYYLFVEVSLRVFKLFLEVRFKVRRVGYLREGCQFSLV